MCKFFHISLKISLFVSIRKTGERFFGIGNGVSPRDILVSLGMKLRILFANKFFHPGDGSETVSFQSIENLQRMGHEVIPFSMKHPSNLSTPYSKYFVTEVNYHDQNGSFVSKLKIATSLIYSWEAKKKMERLLKDHPPHIAHLHNIYDQFSPSILPILKKRGIPVVMTLHDFNLACPNDTFLRGDSLCEICEGKNFYQAIKHRCIYNSLVFSALCAVEMYVHRWWGVYTKSVDLFIALSQFTKNKMTKYGIPEEKIVVLPNCIDLSLNYPTGETEDYILFVGRLSEKDGIITLVKAMERLPQVKLVIAGEGELKEKLLEIKRTKKLDNIHLAGFLKGDKLKELVNGAKFVVFPAICYHNCPMVLLESLSFAKPVIASNLGSIPEFVEDGVDGLLFEPGDPFDLAEKIKYLYQKPLLVKKMGIAGRLKIENRFSKDVYYPQLLNIYQNLLEGGKSEDSLDHYLSN